MYLQNVNIINKKPNKNKLLMVFSELLLETYLRLPLFAIIKKMARKSPILAQSKLQRGCDDVVI